jgi:HNH endonuclease/AP2 domain
MSTQTVIYKPSCGKFVNVSKPERPEAVRSQNGQGYLAVRHRGETYAAHRLAWFLKTGAWPEGPVSFKNGDRTDLHFSNLKCMSMREIGIRRKQPRSSKLYLAPIGVTWHVLRNRWMSRICGADGKSVHLGYFKDAQTAAASYRAAKRKLHGI